MPTRTGGRTRSEDAHAEALKAAVQILEESGYAAVTIEGVATRSGVAKSTLYRWWSNKADLVMEAYTQLTESRMPTPDTGRVKTDLTEFVTALYQVAAHPTRTEALKGLMAQAQLDPTFAKAFRTWIDTRRALLTAIFTRATTRGELPKDIDVDHAVDLIFGPFWYRLLIGHAPISPADAESHIRQLLRALSAP